MCFKPQLRGADPSRTESSGDVFGLMVPAVPEIRTNAYSQVAVSPFWPSNSPIFSDAPSNKPWPPDIRQGSSKASQAHTPVAQCRPEPGGTQPIRTFSGRGPGGQLAPRRPAIHGIGDSVGRDSSEDRQATELFGGSQPRFMPVPHSRRRHPPTDPRCLGCPARFGTGTWLKRPRLSGRCG